MISDTENVPIVSYLAISIKKRLSWQAKSGERKNIDIKRQRLRDKAQSFFKDFHGDRRIGMVNMGNSEAINIGILEKSIKYTINIQFDPVRSSLTWNKLFPSWIDEENSSSSCPQIPMPNLSLYEELDVVMASLPCKWPETNWKRDVFRLQVHLVVANVAVKRGVRDERGKVRIVLKSKCRPMMEVFRCDDLVKREGEWWFYEVEVRMLEEKVALPVGSCKLASDSAKEGNNTHIHPQREAYATVLHSSSSYVCGAIVLAQSILKSGSTRDLILLHDSIPDSSLQALSAAGWKLHPITRIRNPHARRNTYNEYNYSKLRLWQLTDYKKIIFVDSDLLILRNIDFLFQLPEISAAGNHDSIFNSGVMLIEPSNCTFKVLMSHTHDVTSYNGGYKPWACYRDYDCNWNRMESRVYANDIAHWRWWNVYDAMDDKLKRYCGLSEKRKWSLENERKKAEKLRFEDEHWKLTTLDPRKYE
ncbi:uncharacterized protein A4U43_C07F25020 [Asparagus officinalis]|uniref:Hexosyltransferase n=1 Tax=Asparagus officinalis TaxID=4686 RepID=A0A5P1EES4_ASPOF|nr:uncharacterized protein A4U43_C07F25020 [Asparagus officinalis]